MRLVDLFSMLAYRGQSAGIVFAGRIFHAGGIGPLDEPVCRGIVPKPVRLATWRKPRNLAGTYRTTSSRGATSKTINGIKEARARAYTHKRTFAYATLVLVWGW